MKAWKKRARAKMQRAMGKREGLFSLRFNVKGLIIEDGKPVWDVTGIYKRRIFGVPSGLRAGGEG